MLACAPVGFYYGEEAAYTFLLASGICGGIGAFLAYWQRNAKRELTKREGYIIVTLGWVFLTLTGSMPYVLIDNQWAQDQVNTFSFTNAVFETMSGYTTTGATIFQDIEILPKSLLLWRSLTHWIGGMGIIVLTIAILPLLGIGGMQLFVAEAPGVTTDKLHPRITDTAKRLWILYVVYTLAQTLMLWAAGMGLFDAVNHAFSTMATGGFSTKNQSVAYWHHQPLIQYIIIFFMLLAGSNFVLGYFFIKRKWDKLITNTEFRHYLMLISFFTIVISGIIYLEADPALNSLQLDSGQADTLPVPYTMEQSLRYALFTVVSIVTTTGFITVNLANFTTFVSVLFILLMFTGGMAGSTSGGIKVVRHVILLKSSLRAFKNLLHPSAIIPLRFNGKSVSQNIISHVLAFFMVYMICAVAGSILMGLLDTGSSVSDGEILSLLTVPISFLGNIGPTLGKYDPVSNFSAMATPAKWLSAFLMLLGRLELFTVLILFTPYFWKK
ncbi:MAG: TrkH family potassium uptake protein [Weeksellaceae bacterium]|nr:TrkH family potassium uptake protein [Weeksellaceae bacterium]